MWKQILIESMDSERWPTDYIPTPSLPCYVTLGKLLNFPVLRFPQLWVLYVGSPGNMTVSPDLYLRTHKSFIIIQLTLIIGKAQMLTWHSTIFYKPIHWQLADQNPEQLRADNSHSKSYSTLPLILPQLLSTHPSNLSSKVTFKTIFLISLHLQIGTRSTLQATDCWHPVLPCPHRSHTCASLV